MVVCLLVGAVAIPVGYQKRKADEIARLEQELAQRCNELQLCLALHSGGRSLPGGPPPTIATPPPGAETRCSYPLRRVNLLRSHRTRRRDAQMSCIPRRRFLYLASGSASLAVTSPLLVSKFHQNNGLDDFRTGALCRVKRKSWALGSTVTMTALHQDTAIASAALEAAFSELETVEQVMSIYRPESQLCRLNRDGRCDDPHPYLIEVLEAAAAMSQRTQGAFDVTVEPLWQSYWQAHSRGAQPTAAEIASACRRVDWRHVEVTERRIRLLRSGTAVTLNGIAQGYAADRATEALRRHGVDQALIDTGEFGALGQGSDGDGWNVGIQHPRHADAFVAIANLAGRCLATSGDYATSFDKSFTTHHLFDPHSGRSASELASVSIVAESGLAADALSTATFVMGFDAGRQLVTETPGVDALFVTKNGQTWTSPGFPIHKKV